MNVRYRSWGNCDRRAAPSAEPGTCGPHPHLHTVPRAQRATTCHIRIRLETPPIRDPCPKGAAVVRKVLW